MNRFVLPFLSLFLLVMIGCTNNAPKSTYKEDAKEQLAQTDDIERFKLFPTQNMWTFIKLDTQTGQMWQVQYSVKGDEGRFEYDLNPKPLITIGKKVNGRFELYSTQNIYNFILLDRIDGKVWQVQWSFDEENRAVVPFSRTVQPYRSAVPFSHRLATGATKFIIIGNYDSIARFRCMYRCYSCCCHNSDSPIIKKEVKRTDFKNQEHYSFPSQPRKLGKNTKARKR